MSRTWCLCAFSLLWHKPAITKTSQLVSLTRVLASSSATLPYTTSIRKLNLTSVAGSLSDDLLKPFEACSRVERLALNGVTKISKDVLRRVVSGMKSLTTMDLSHVGAVEEQVMLAISERCERLQGLNLFGCKMVVDEGLKAIAERCRMLRRVSHENHSTAS